MFGNKLVWCMTAPYLWYKSTETWSVTAIKYFAVLYVMLVPWPSTCRSQQVKWILYNYVAWSSQLWQLLWGHIVLWSKKTLFVETLHSLATYFIKVVPILEWIKNIYFLKILLTMVWEILNQNAKRKNQIQKVWDVLKDIYLWQHIQTLPLKWRSI